MSKCLCGADLPCPKCVTPKSKPMKSNKNCKSCGGEGGFYNCLDSWYDCPDCSSTPVKCNKCKEEGGWQDWRGWVYCPDCNRKSEEMESSEKSWNTEDVIALKVTNAVYEERLKWLDSLEKFTVEVSILDEVMQLSDSDIFNYTRDRMAAEIGKKLMEEGYVAEEITNEKDRSTGSSVTRFRYKVTVLKPANKR